MKYQIDNFKISPIDDNRLDFIIVKKLKICKFKYKILQKSIDARDKNNVLLIYKLLIETNEKIKNAKLYVEKNNNLEYKKFNGPSPVVVGFGPSGMFAALYLARCNAKPIIIERGSKIEDRKLRVSDFLEKKILTPNCNVQFGEGGAGAFSDGKLVTNVKDPLINFILNEFYIHGALEDVLYDTRPHVGTDYLEIVVKNIRKEIESLGGIFYFDTLFTGFEETDNGLNIFANNEFLCKTNNLILGVGHSAKDTIRYLYNDKKIVMEQKAFSMGVRIEHPKELIDEAQYGRFHKYLPAAYYKLASHNNGRGVYTFCMCPGGYVLASASDENTIVTNGMSNNSRDNVNSNSALLVDVLPSDYNKGNVLDGIDYQERYERLAFDIAKDYRAPANLVKEFLNDEVAVDQRSVHTSYPHGLIMTNLSKCLPDYVIANLKFGLNEFDKKLNGFKYDDAIMIGVESRSSSAIRIIRDEKREASIKGVYPIGEGAGYAGGITSAALDGLKTAIMIVNENNNL